MQPHQRALGVIVMVAAASSALAVMPVVTVAVAAGGFCCVGASYHGTTITWTGKGNGHSWTDAANWSPRTVPDAHQRPATYQTQYVCIGEGKGGRAATVTIPGTAAFHVAGIDVGEGAALTVDLGGRLFLGAAKGSAVVASSVDKHSELQLDGAMLGGNSPLTVRGSMRWTGDLISKGHRAVATQTSSECVADPSIPACPGDTSPGGGRTVIAASGKLLVDGVKFGEADLTDGRVIDNSGTLKLTHSGYVSMGDGSSLIDEAGSSLILAGSGGIFRGSKQGHGKASIRQRGSITRDGAGTDGAVISVPISLGKHKPAVSVLGGTLILDGTKAPKAAARRATRYGLGTCPRVTSKICKRPIATSHQRQVAVLGTSSESAAPAVSKVAVSLVKAPKKVHGHRVLGQAIRVRAPKKKTTHSTHLTFGYDVKTAGLTSHTSPTVYRGKHAIPLCRVHGLTALNTSCIFSEDVSRSGKGIKGDLTIVLITIQPNARWLVTR